MPALRPGESFLTAATRDRKAADRRKEKALQKDEAEAAAKTWATSRSIFVPTALAAKKPVPKKRNVMPGTEYRGNDKRTASQQASDERRAQVRKLNTETRRKERFQLGLKTAKPQSTIFDAVPVGRTKHDQEIARALDHPPPTLTPRELHDWRKKMIGFSTFSPADKRHYTQQADREYVPPDTKSLKEIAQALGGAAETVGKGAFGVVQKGASFIDPSPIRTTGNQFGPSKLGPEPLPEAVVKRRAESALENTLGKGITNAVLHGDMPNTAMQGAGLAAGVLTIGPAGKIGRAGFVGGKLAFDAIKAEQGIRAALGAAKAGSAAAYSGPSVTSKVIQWGKAARAARPYSPATAKAVRENAGMLVEQRQALVAAGEHDAAAQLEQILAKADLGPNGEFHGWDEVANGKRLASKLNPKNIAKGVVYGNNRTIRNAAGIHVAGPFSNEDWVEKVIAAFPTEAERQQWAQWYEEFQPAFREMFGSHAEEMMRGFAVSQANNSPTGGLLATLRVLDRLQAGDTAASISNRGVGTKSLVKTIAKAVEGVDGKVDKGVAAKLSDFIDSFLRKNTRTIMGDAVEGGKPSAIDVHAMRDQGLIDKKLVAKLEAVHGLKFVDPKVAAKRALKDTEFTIDSQGAASGPLYERLSERYEQIAEHLNAMDEGRGFDGRNNWEPREVQALGWGATQKIHGVEPENLASAFAGNTRTFNLQVGKNLTEEEAARVSEALAPHVEKIVAQAGDSTFPIGGAQIGIFGGKHGANSSIHFQVLSSPEKAQALSDRLATIFKQYDVTAYKVGGSGAKPHLRIRNVPGEEGAAAIFASLKEQDPKRFTKYTLIDDEMILAVPGKQITAAAKDAFGAEMAPLIAKAEKAAGIPDDAPLHFDGANLQIKKGKPNARLRRGRGGGRGESLERQTDAEARAALDDAVGRINESRARAAGRRLVSEERGALDISAFRNPGRAVEEEAPVAPERVPRFKSKEVPRTQEGVEARISQIDAKLGPILDDAARSLKRQGHGAGTRDTLARTDKPDYFNSYGSYEQAKIDAWEKKVAAFKKKNPGAQYRGPHYTDQWPHWGEKEDFRWGDKDTYALETKAQVKTDASMEWYREQAEEQIVDHLTRMVSEGGADGLKARRMLIMFQERNSLKELLRRNQVDDIFGAEDVPGTGFGSDLKATRLKPPPLKLAGESPPPTKPPAVPRQLPDPEFDADFLKKLRKQLVEALPAGEKQYKEQAVLRTEERGKRAKSAFDAFHAAGGGAKGMLAMKEELAGELPKLEWGGFDFLDDESMGALIDHAAGLDDLGDYEKIRVFWGLKRVMEGRTPTPSETALFRRAFGDKMADNVSDRENLTIWRKMWGWGLDIWNSPRSLMASYDISAPFRQGLVSGIDHPILFGRNFKPMMKAFRSEGNYESMMDEIVNRENWPRYEKMKLAITDAMGSGAGREEAFPESMAEKIPGVNLGIKSSSRAYSLFLTKQRVDVADKLIGMAADRGKDVDDPKFLKALGEFINTTTGRGRIPTKYGEEAANFLNGIFFSPRLMASRLQTLNPLYYRRLRLMDPWVAMRARRAAYKTIGEISLATLALSRIPGVEVNTNPTNSDFGKVRVGNTRIDLAGGFQPWIVLAMREYRGETTASSTNVTRKLGGYGGKDRFGLGVRFLSGKMAPSPGLIRDMASDMKTFVGEPLTVKGTALNMLTPLNFQATLEAWRQDGYDMAAIAAVLGTIGFGTNSYPDKEGSTGGGGGGEAEMPSPFGGDSGGGIDMPMPDSMGGGSDMPMPTP